MEEFWALRPLESTDGYGRPLRWFGSDCKFQKIFCPKFEDHQRPGNRIGELSVLIKNRLIGDVLWTWYNECVIQDRLFKKLIDKKFTGYEIKKIKTHFKNENNNADKLQFHEFVITGTAGDASAKSGVCLVDYCKYCMDSEFSAPTNLSELIDEKEWDGSDFFIVWPLAKYIIVTSRVAKFFNEENINGARLIKVENLSFGKNSSLSPGLPSPYIRHQRFDYGDNGEIKNWEELI